MSETLRRNMKSTLSFRRFRGKCTSTEYLPKGGKGKKPCEIVLSQMQMKLNPLKKLKYSTLCLENLKGSYSVNNPDPQSSTVSPPLKHFHPSGEPFNLPHTPSACPRLSLPMKALWTNASLTPFIFKQSCTPGFLIMQPTFPTDSSG